MTMNTSNISDAAAGRSCLLFQIYCVLS